MFEISDRLEVLDVPGHSPGSIAVYHPARQALFSGDLVYECGDGGALIDWLPTSSVSAYVHSAGMMLDWLAAHTPAPVSVYPGHDHTQPGAVTVYPGHFSPLTGGRAADLLRQYVRSKDNDDGCGRCCTHCMQMTTTAFFVCGCFRCCPC